MGRQWTRMRHKVYAVYDYEDLVAVFATAELADAWVKAERETGNLERNLNISEHQVISEMPRRVIRYFKRNDSEAVARKGWDFERPDWFDSAEEALNS